MNHSAVETAPETAQSTGLQPRLIKGLQADFIPAVWPGSNTSGLRVFGIHVLIRMDECAPTSRGGIALPEELVSRMTEASETGCIYALGGNAFAHNSDGTRWSGECPTVGERVYIARYAGAVAMGADGHTYRIVEDGAICAGLLDPTSEGDAE